MQAGANQSETIPSQTALQLLTLTEIAALLRVSKKTIYYWVNRNEIPFLRIGRHLRFNPEVVLAFFSLKTEERKPPCFRSRPTLQNGARSLKTGNSAKNGCFDSAEKE